MTYTFRLAVLFAALFTAASCAQTCAVAEFFAGLSDLPGGATSSVARALSGDGSTVVGASVSAASTPNTEAFRWTSATGMQGMGDLAGGIFKSEATAVSFDGSIVAGIGAPGSGTYTGANIAMLYDAPSGWTSLGDVLGGAFYSEANALSDNGQAVGGGTHGQNLFRASYWTPGFGWTQLENASGFQSVVRRFARNGQWAAAGRSATGVQEPCLVDSSTGSFTVLPHFAGASQPHSISWAATDAGDLVGYGYTPNGYEAALWSAGGAPIVLGDFAGGIFGSVALGVSTDGSLIVGYGTSALGKEAAAWDAGGIHRIVDLLTAAGVVVPAGWTLEEAVDVVVDGASVTVCGNGLNPSGNAEAWVARYVSVTTGLSYPGSGDGFVLATGLNGAACSTGLGFDQKSLLGGGYLTACLSATCPALFGAPVALAGQILPGGTPLLPSAVPHLWLDPAALVLLVDGTAPGPFGPSHVAVPGGLAFGFQVPVVLATYEIALQAAVFTAALPLGFALSEAHVVTIL